MIGAPIVVVRTTIVVPIVVVPIVVVSIPIVVPVIVPVIVVAVGVITAIVVAQIANILLLLLWEVGLDSLLQLFDLIVEGENLILSFMCELCSLLHTISLHFPVGILLYDSCLLLNEVPSVIFSHVHERST